MSQNVSIDYLDDYLEKIYDLDVKEKVKGSFMIMQLARNPDYLDTLITNETLLGALSRVLKEEGKSSMDLFHEIIETYGVGKIVMRTIEYEDRRYTELKRASKNKPDADNKRKIKVMLEKQEKLLYVCFHILLNLAEDINAELQMKKLKLIPYLWKNLDRKNVDLLTLTVTFLKKLSIFQENKNEMLRSGIMYKLFPLIEHKNESLANESLRLMLNLSFDPDMRKKIADALPHLTRLIQNPTHHEVCVKLLYQISQDEKAKSNFQFTDLVAIILEYVVEYPDQKVNKELIALAINISTHERNAERMVANRGLKRLMERLIRTQDSLLAKLIRNLSQHERVRPVFQPFIPSVVGMATKTQQPELSVELLGIFGNMTFSNYSFEPLFKQYNLIDFLYEHLLPGRNEDDIILETIICVGVVITNKETAYMISKSNIVRAVCDLFVEKQDDDEIALQILYTFFKFISYEPTRNLILRQKQIITSLVNLLQDKNSHIRKMADQNLEVIMHFNQEWAEMLKRKKFEIHNEQWLHALEKGGMLTNANPNESFDSVEEEHDEYMHEDSMDRW